MSESGFSRAGQVSWQLVQTFWVGGLWGLHFVVLPGIGKVGIAPLLIEEIRAALVPLLLGFAACAVLLQMLVLVRACGLRSILRDVRGQALLAVQLLIASHFLVRGWLPEQPYWQVFSYLAVAMCGLVLVVQPAPGAGRADAEPQVRT